MSARFAAGYRCALRNCLAGNYSDRPARFICMSFCVGTANRPRFKCLAYGRSSYRCSSGPS